MTTDPWADPPESLYVSAAREQQRHAYAYTDAQGRVRLPDAYGFPLYNGPLCDRIGCTAAGESTGARFCVEHRREHGARLLAQLNACIAMNRARLRGSSE